MSYIGDEDYDYERRHRRRPSPRRNHTETRRSQLFLNPNTDGGGLYRTRSQGQGPVPIVNVIQDANLRSTPQSPPYPPYPPSPPRGRRTSDRLGEELVEDFRDLAMENARLRSRSRHSRSRVRSDAGLSSGRSEYLESELRQRDRELRDYERRSQRDKTEEQLRMEYENQRLKDEAKRKDDEAAKKRDKERIIDDYEDELREQEEDKKREEKRMREKIEREEKEAKEKEEREWKEFLRKQQERKEKEEKENKEKEEEIDEAMRRRLSKAGMPYKQIEAIINDEKEKKKTHTTTTTTTITGNRPGNQMDLWQPRRAPVYAKIHRDYLSVDTLKYYDVPFEYDRKDANYLIVLREMDKYETDVLFEHTRRLRDRKPNLLLGAPEKQPQYAWYRKRDRSTSRVRKLGILEFK